MIYLSYTILVSLILFVFGLIGVITRRNILLILFNIEVMLNSSTIIFVSSANYWNNFDGYIMYIIILSFIACKSSIFLALLVQLNKRLFTLSIDII